MRLCGKNKSKRRDNCVAHNKLAENPRPYLSLHEPRAPTPDGLYVTLIEPSGARTIARDAEATHACLRYLGRCLQSSPNGNGSLVGVAHVPGTVELWSVGNYNANFH